MDTSNHFDDDDDDLEPKPPLEGLRKRKSHRTQASSESESDVPLPDFAENDEQEAQMPTPPRNHRVLYGGAQTFQTPSPGRSAALLPSDKDSNSEGGDVRREE